MPVKYRGYWEYYCPVKNKLKSDYFYDVDMVQLQLMLEEMEMQSGAVIKINATRMVEKDEPKTGITDKQS